MIGADGQQVGVVSLSDALKQAEELGLDVVEVSPQADPPVAKLVDWGKYQYEQTKKEQRAKRNSRAQEMKQIRFGLKIGEHDLEVKRKQIRKFLEKGHKVKLTVRFRGREITHEDLGHQLLDSVVESLNDIAVVDQPPQLAGKQLNMVIRKK